MSDTQWVQMQSAMKVALAFVNAFAGFIAAYPGPELNPLWRMLFAATVAGCGAALLILNPPTSKTQDERVAAILEAKMKRTRAGGV